ncbi:hypothetical protein HDC35_000638 [Sphingopyxis sp. JAI128]|nr:hypothetical protein [Sphingopyxis sp. JAI128]
MGPSGKECFSSDPAERLLHTALARGSGVFVVSQDGSSKLFYELPADFLLREYDVVMEVCEPKASS